MRKMNPITKAIRESGITKAEWCARNKVKVTHLNKIMLGAIKPDIGESKRIKELLERDGFWKQLSREAA